MTTVTQIIALTEFRRSVRIAAGDRKKVLMLLGIGVIILGPVTVIGTIALSSAGERVAAGTVEVFDLISVTDVVTGGAAMFWLLLVAMATIRTVTAVAKLDEPAFLLLSTSLRNVVLGLLGAELLGFTVWLAVPTMVLAGAFAYGAGMVLPVFLAPLVVVFLAASAIPVGFVVGIWIRHVFTVYESVARYRTPFFVAIALGYFGLVFSDVWASLMDALFALLQDSPLGWPGHILLFGIPNVSPSLGPLVGAFVGMALVTPLALMVGIASARIHWYADIARTEDESVAEADSSERLDGFLSLVLDRRTRVITQTAVRRTKRAPIRLVYVAYPLFGILPFGRDIIQTGTVPSIVAVLLGMYVVWGSGVLFTLNLLGDLGRAMPTVLTSTVSGRQHVTGHVVAGALVGVPVALLVSALAGIASPLSMVETGALVVGTTVGAVVAPGLATGIGAAFPRFGSVRVTSNREAVMPSKAAFMLYSLAIMLPMAGAAVLYVESAPELVATVLTALLSFIPSVEVTVPPSLLTGASWIVLVAGLLLPFASFYHAVRRFNEYTLD